jgi:ATP-dependent RNA helicase DDX46/PRP5
VVERQERRERQQERQERRERQQERQERRERQQERQERVQDRRRQVVGLERLLLLLRLLWLELR